MDDIRRHDKNLLVKELLNPGRLILAAIAAGFVFISRSTFLWEMNILWQAVGFSIIALVYVNSSYKEAKRKRFINKRFEALWNGCKDRFTRLEDVLGKMRKEQVADLREMPATIREVAQSLYGALRRADLISNEVQKTESGIYSAPPAWQGASNDPQAKELYRLADKNIAEYRQQFGAVMAGVQRTEAQSAVFMTTLDTLRMKLISYRLTGKSPEVSTQEFLEALSEAKVQLHAIDQALDELDFSQFPKTVVIMPPPVEDQHLHHRN
jgi:hypothetical protein